MMAGVAQAWWCSGFLQYVEARTVYGRNEAREDSRGQLLCRYLGLDPSVHCVILVLHSPHINEWWCRCKGEQLFSGAEN